MAATDIADAHLNIRLIAELDGEAAGIGALVLRCRALAALDKLLKKKPNPV